MNITLIGMPGVGKTTIGKALAKEIKYHFLDIDELIEKEEGKPIITILTMMGDRMFILREEAEVLKLKNIDKSIISTGGSIVYSEKAMLHLKKISKIIFLNASISEVKKRIDNAETRGIVGLKEKGFESLYRERDRLYKRYADIVIDGEKLKAKEIVAKIKGIIS